MLMPIFMTHFVQVRFNQNRLPSGLNSCIIFYFFKHDPSSCDLWGKLRKCGLEGMGRFFSNLLHEPNPCVLPSGQRTLVAPQAYGESLVPEISTPKGLLCSS